jgi:PIN domain nuclease of toxin-antitoxin system
MGMSHNMRYLLDTHVILWWLTDPQKIKPKAHEIIRDKSNPIFISSASFWEMAIKKSIGKLTLPHNLLESTISEGFQFLPIGPEDGLGIADLPLLHSDPFDRMLIMQAKRHELVLITNDSKNFAYPVITLEA